MLKQFIRNFKNYFLWKCSKFICGKMHKQFIILYLFLLLKFDFSKIQPAYNHHLQETSSHGCQLGIPGRLISQLVVTFLAMMPYLYFSSVIQHSCEEFNRSYILIVCKLTRFEISLQNNLCCIFCLRESCEFKSQILNLFLYPC